MVFTCDVLLLFLNVFCQPHSQSNDQLSETQQNTSKSHDAANTQKISQKAKSIKTAVRNIISPSPSTMLSGKVAMWKAIHFVSVVVTVLWKQHWVICRGTSIDVRCVVKVFCRQRMKIVSCCCRTQADAQSVDVCAWFSRQYYFYLNTETFIWICFPFFFKDAWSFWPDGGSEPAQVFRHVGNSQDSTHRLPCPENYSGLLLEVCTHYAVQSYISTALPKMSDPKTGAGSFQFLKCRH